MKDPNRKPPAAIIPGWRRAVLAAIALVSAFALKLEAASTRFDSLAFIPETNGASTVTLPANPALNWTPVVFRPERTNRFPEELKLLRTIQAPADKIAALAMVDDELWLLSRSTRRVYCLETRTGMTRRDFGCPGEGPAGMAWAGHTLWVTDRPGRVVFGLDRSGKVLKRFPLAFEPGAILSSTDGLLVGNWDKDEFLRLDSESGQVLATNRAPDNHLGGLAVWGRYLWCARGAEIILHDPERGLPVCGFNVAPFRGASIALGGLVVDGDTFWFGNSTTNQLSQIRIPRHGEWVAGGGWVRQAGFEMTYRNTSTQSVDSLRILQHVPFLEMPGQRYLALQIQPTPRALYRDDLGNVMARLDLGPLPAGGIARCEIACGMWVADRRMVVDPDRLAASSYTPDQLAYARRFHPIAGENSPEVTALVEKAALGETNAYWKIRNAHDALCRAIYYREPKDESVAGVLRQGYGVCRNYSAAMESFGRLLGVPVLNAWAPRHETCFLMLPGVSPSVLEVTANDGGPDPATTWRRSRWFLGTSKDEITTGVRGCAMHNPLLLDGVTYSYRWHYWMPANVTAIRHDGWWTVTDAATGKKKRL